MLPQIAQGDANKIWVIPSEFTQALSGLSDKLGLDAAPGAPAGASDGAAAGGRPPLGSPPAPPPAPAPPSPSAPPSDPAS
jgi:hypothetical protein